MDGTGQPYLALLPNFTAWELALMVFVVPIAIGWWANWYPGSEPGGGSYIAQRMLASKSEKDALKGTLFFNLAIQDLGRAADLLDTLVVLSVIPVACAVVGLYSAVSDISL